MTFGVYFENELQKLSARAISTGDVIKELVKRQKFKSIMAGFDPAMSYRFNVLDRQPWNPIGLREYYKGRDKALEGIKDYAVDLRFNAVPNGARRRIDDSAFSANAKLGTLRQAIVPEWARGSISMSDVLGNYNKDVSKILSIASGLK